MKIIFAGTPQFAADALAALLTQSHQIIAVYTQPDRPSGRGMQLTPSPVKQLALQHQIPVLQPPTLKNAEAQQQVQALQADVMIVAAYGLILPKAVLEMPRYGCLNIHGSLLPRWRGAAPIQRALLAGDSTTGITIMQMDEGLDTGAMLLKKTCAIENSDTSQTLHDKLAALGAEAIIEALQQLEKGNLHAQAQDNHAACYAAKLGKAEAQLDWTQSAESLDRAIRAYNPFPGAFATLNGTVIKIWQAAIRKDRHGAPGTVLEVAKDGVLVACGNGALLLQVLQKPNAKALPSAQFLQGFKIQPGDCFV